MTVTAPSTTVVTAPPAQAEQTPLASPTQPEPTATPLPLAVKVNGLEITLAEYEAELTQFSAARGGAELSAEEKQLVLDNLIEQALLAQAAFQQGYSLSDAQLDERIAQLSAQIGGAEALSSWKQANGYTDQSFRLALARSMAAAWMRDQIIAQVPRTAEQVHARQILLYNSEEADQVYSLLQAGNDFGNLAAKYDPVTRGDLGWFPRGYLADPKLEEVIFGLQVEAFSPVIETLAGYHIVQLLEREAQRPLSPEALLQLQIQAVQDWLEEHRSQSQIELFIP
ncbi:MAG: peptidylprolyl isomerase [Anaerolineales bacterium]|nr:peptidylprolyl isomerase [Anaerolineales bacterium]